MRNTLFGICLLFSGLIPAQAQDFIGPRAPGPDSVILARIEEWARVLLNELGYLQDDITTDLDGRIQRDLSRLSREALRGTMDFRRHLRRGVSHRQLTRQLHQLDQSIRTLSSAIQDLPARLRSLHRTAERIRLASGQIGYFVATSNPWADTELSFLRQTTLLVNAAQELAQITKHYRTSSFGRQLHASVEHYYEHLSSFRAKVKRNQDRRYLQKEYRDITQDWKEIQQALSKIRFTPQMTNLRAQVQHVEDLHYGLYRLVTNKPHHHYPDRGDRDGLPQLPLPESKAINQFVQSIQGTWTLVALHANGRVSKRREPRSTFVINGNRWQVNYADGNSSRGTFQVVSKSRTHFHANFYLQGTRTPMLAILKLENNLFHYCATTARQGRPESFSAPRGNKAQSYSIWQRARR